MKADDLQSVKFFHAAPKLRQIAKIGDIIDRYRIVAQPMLDFGDSKRLFQGQGDKDVVYRPVTDGAVLFNVQDEAYFGLNTSGAYIWEALPPVSYTMDELCARLGARYPDVDAATLRADVVELLEQLISYGLLERDVNGGH